MHSSRYSSVSDQHPMDKSQTAVSAVEEGAVVVVSVEVVALVLGAASVSDGVSVLGAVLEWGDALV